MLVVTNPGSNVPAELVRHYGIEMTPQQIMVDGVAHDTLVEAIPFAQIDDWVRSAREHPYVLGTNAAQFVALFHKASQRDKEIFAVMTSRKVIGSHDAAVVAARTIAERHPDIRIGVGDSGATDLGAGLATLLGSEARDAGLDVAGLEDLMRAIHRDLRLVLTVRTLDYMVKGGRASGLRRFFADLLGLRPVIAFVDGELKAVGKYGTKSDPTVALAGWLEGEVPGKPAVWAGVFHGGAPASASILAKELRARFDVRYLLTRPVSPSIYLHTGPESIGAVVLPLAGLPWQPAKTPPAVD